VGIPLRVLFIEDNPDDMQLVALELQRFGYDLASPLRVETRQQLAAVIDRPWDLAVSDFHLPALTAPTALALWKQRQPMCPFIIVSGTVDEDQAVAALRSGASDFINKQKLTRLGPAVARELRDRAEREGRRQAESQLLQAQKMDVIGQLAAGVAHDLNNVLGVILGHGEILGRQADPGGQDKKRLSVICDAARRGAGLVNQLLAVGRRQVLQPRTLSLNDTVGETLAMLERVIGEHVELRSDLAGDLRPIRADVAQLEQVIMNLVVNARDAMPKGGVLRIATRNVGLDPPRGDASGACVLLEVQDSGHGMDEATLAHIFEPFFTTKEPGKGTGLGLATVYGIVKQSGGHIEVESERGKGTLFRVFLPCTEAPAVTRTGSGAVSPAPRGGRETILLVEDDVMLRSIAHEILSAAGYRVISPETPEDALQIGAAEPIHLLLTDVVMPRVSGFDLAERVAEARPSVKIVLMSGYTRPTDRARPSNARFLAKPFSMDALLGTVREALDDGKTLAAPDR
jgi:signal transduction histidine kinase